MRKNDFKEYLNLVKEYKNTSDKKVKAQINKSIENIKGKFYASVFPKYSDSEQKIFKKFEEASELSLFDKFDTQKFNELKKRTDEIRKQYLNRRESDSLYANSLEWRLEFPEVLDDEGNFVGFDIVIANPPYIFARNQSFDDKSKQYYLSHYEVDEYQANTYTLFMELGYKLLKENGTFAYIVPNNMLTIQSNQKIRDFLLKKSGYLVLINSLDKIFADANVDNCLVFLKKNKSDEVTVGELDHGDFQTVGTVDKKFFGTDKPIFSISMVKYRDTNKAYLRMNSNKTIESIALLKSGVKAYEVGKGKPAITKQQKDNRIYHSKEKIDDTYLPYIEGRDVRRYSLGWSGEYIKYGENLAAMRDPKLFIGERILVRQIPSRSVYAIEATLTSKHIINDLNSMIITNIDGYNPFALLGIINSRLLTLWFLIKFDKFQRRLFPQFKVNELSQFPIPQISNGIQEKIANKVKIVMNKAMNGKNFSVENNEIDELVMDAFNLTEEEKQSVRDFTF
ncbi:hypothetical protein J2Z60_000385 [Lactobacillus colini]|uniref:site-specific DNA-methyltransferase (adenine-specific) n=1 Tax=Lactobacillus colini TaxID=1819254 RepID=A0ABS4MC40_9LACO|nr:TaqI-like C-terminal specificity domain-containing protein [Lactobacillus colini]MBP2057221.1 hypothetical protein [Lactobacillus colini]